MSGSARVIEVNRDDPIVVTALGMVSSLGLDAATSCAAARAGIRRAQPLDYLRFASLDGRSVESAVGHPVPIITHGFEGAARLAQLAAGALRDLTNGWAIPIGARVGFYISMPSCRRHLTGAELVPDPDAKEVFLEEIEDLSSTLDDESWTEHVMSVALRQTGFARDLRLRFVTYAGHTGFAEALAVAVEHLHRNEIDLALVGAIDSLTDERTLKWLRLTGRLKGEANPTGLEPGECAVFVAAERREQAARRRASPISRIGTIVTAEEERPHILGQQPTGNALSTCISSAIDVVPNLWLVTDQNGEANRATELGNVLAKISNTKGQLLPALLPAASFGDTGAASGGVAVCMAQTAFLRSYSSAHVAVVASAADGLQRAAFSIVRFQEH
jgi:3-oxoacyl-[acyl-carrier-protein] synthase-1